MSDLLDEGRLILKLEKDNEEDNGEIFIAYSFLVALVDTIEELQEDNKYVYALTDRVANQNDELKDQITKLQGTLSPRTWTKEMHDAWHKNLPDTLAAFKAIAELKQ